MRIVLLFLLVAVSFGCTPHDPAAECPRRILSLSAASTKVLYDLGIPPVAIDEYGLIAAGTPVPTVVGKGGTVSREKVKELGVDCVILWYYQQDAARVFRKDGLHVVEVKTFRLHDYPEFIRSLGKLTGKESKAEELCRKYNEQLSLIPRSTLRKNVYFELYAPMKSVGKESYIGDLIFSAGGLVLNQKTSLINMESLLPHQPEIIFYIEGHGSAEEIKKRPGFSSYPAVRKNRIHAVPRRLITEGVAPLEAIQFFQKHISEE